MAAFWRTGKFLQTKAECSNSQYLRYSTILIKGLSSELALDFLTDVGVQGFLVNGRQASFNYTVSVFLRLSN